MIRDDLTQDLRVVRRVRRILFLRRHKLLLTMAGTLGGAAMPMAGFVFLVWFSHFLVMIGSNEAFRFFYLFLAPLSLFSVIPAGILGFFIARSVGSQRMPYGYCQFCGYNLQEYTVPRCPECGKTPQSEY